MAIGEEYLIDYRILYVMKPNNWYELRILVIVKD